MRKIIVVGSGVIGLGCALFFALEGERVQVITRNPEEPASWVAGGMLAPFSEELEGELFQFSYESLKEYPEFIRFLEEASKKRVDFREGGIYRLVLKGEEEVLERSRAYARAGYGVEWVEPWSYLSEEVLSVVHYKEEAWVDTESLMDALFSALRRLGVNFTIDNIKGLVMEGKEVKNLRGNASDYRGDFYLFAPGAWARELFDLPVYPVKGQAIKVKGADLERVHYSSSSYLIPRMGYLYIGATSEEVGFTPGNTLEGLRRLCEMAMRVVPSLGESSLMGMLYGYRPTTPDGKPIFEVGENYLILTGHHRNGILHTPMTAKLALDYLKGSRNKFLEAFSKDRFLKKT
ncbi:MAG: FAD-dependent oxidoreductase [Aquificaceae bacterium]|nr:FAD-dependent oxidoreductase [Aquificaceae bacterium]